jgi:hypothetical protein
MVAVFSGMWLSAGRARVMASRPTRAPIRAIRSARSCVSPRRGAGLVADGPSALVRRWHAAVPSRGAEAQAVEAEARVDIPES